MVAAALASLPLLGSGARAQVAPTKVVLNTAVGTLEIDLYGDKAPITVRNFLRYIDEKRFDGAEFYRTVRVEGLSQAGLIQGGCHGDPKRLLPKIETESTAVTGLRHKVGTLSMPRLEGGQASGEFFICLEDSPWYDVNPIKPGDNLGYAAFGQVVGGFDVALKIHDMPVSPTLGRDYGMANQILDPPVKIVTARRV